MHLTKQDKLLVIMTDWLMHSPAPLRDRVEQFESMLQDMPSVELEVEHAFLDGVYRRTTHFPAGAYATGAVHTKENFDVMLTGEMLVATKDGFKHLVAPLTLQTGLDVRKAGIAIKDTTWISYHATSATNVEDALAEFTAGDYTDITADYEVLLKERGITEEDAQADVQLDNVDLTPLPGLVTKSSDIHGVGLFTTDVVYDGTVICAMLEDGRRTLAGRYVNHSPLANCKMVLDGTTRLLVATANIEPGEELTTNYRDSITAQEEVWE